MVRQVFVRWENGSTNPTRNLSISGPKTIQATYKEVISIANVEFTGLIDPVTAGPRPVTITVTLPGGSQESLEVTTDDQGNFLTTKQYPPSEDDYIAKASVPKDAKNKAGESPEEHFTVGLADTVVTLKVTVTP